MPETDSEMHDRLCGVLAASRFEVLPQPYAWQEIKGTPSLPATALAMVRDGSAWYALAPVAGRTAGAYRILKFHFAEGLNASGFVAWVAALMKKEAATGAMVVFGFDARATAALWQRPAMLALAHASISIMIISMIDTCPITTTEGETI